MLLAKRMEVMAKVLVELEKSNSTTELAILSLEKVFSKLNIEFRFRFLNVIKEEDLNWCDSYLAVRPYSPMSLSIARAINKSNRFYTVLFDDDLVNRKDASRWRISCAKKCIKYASVVISPNPILAQEYAQISAMKRYAILNTPIDESEIMPIHQIGDKIRFVYAAGRDHAEFFEKQIKPVLNVFLKEYAQKVHFTFIGVEPDLSDVEYKECFSFIPLMPLDSYNNFMKNNLFEVGLAPLDDTDFSNRKYFNKFIEYSKVGILGLYTNCLPFKLIVQNRVNGILVDNNKENWLRALKFVVENPSFIEKCVHNSQNELRERFQASMIASIIKAKLPEYEVSESFDRKKVSWHYTKINFIFFKIIDKWQKLNYYLLNKGMSNSINMIQNYLKDKTKKNGGY